MKKKRLVLIVGGSLFVGFMAGGTLATVNIAKQNKEIWLGVLDLIKRVDLVMKPPIL